MCYHGFWKTNTTAPNDNGFRFTPEIINHAVWLSFRLLLRCRDVKELLAQRGIVVIDETICQWCLACGQMDANDLRRRRLRCGDTWHLDEVFLTFRGESYSLWRAMDQNGNVLDVLVQSRRNKHAARRFFRKLFSLTAILTRVSIAVKLKSYGAAKREILPGVEHRQHKGLNNRAEKPYQLTRLRERKENAAVHISQTGPTLSLCLRSHYRVLSTTTSPFEGRGIAHYFTIFSLSRSLQRLAKSLSQ